MSENKELAEKTAIAALLKNQIEVQKAVLTQFQCEYETVCLEIQNILEVMEIDSVKMNGYTFFTQEESSVKIPKTPEDREALFNFLKEKGLFDSLITINSQTLNSLYKSFAENALQEGILEFQMPGIEKPTPFKRLRLRKI